jgi:hypothetical protein
MCKISHIILIPILLIILTFWDKVKADDYGIKQLGLKKVADINLCLTFQKT